MKQVGGPPHGRYGANAPRSYPCASFDTLRVRSPRKGRMTRWHGTGPASWRTTMNPLALIKQQLEKAARLREAQHASLVYRGVAYVPKPHWF